MRGRLVASVVGTVVALCLVEGLGRMLHWLPTRPLSAYVALTRRVGPLPPPGPRPLADSAGGSRHWISFNDLGFRSPTTQFARDGVRRPRIVALGDSYTAAWQVALEERFTEQLERLQGRWSVLNLGMPNWGTDQQYLLLLNYPFATPPDVVLLVMTPLNDVADNGRALLHRAPERPHFVPANSRSSGALVFHAGAWRYRDPSEEADQGPLTLRIRSWLRLYSVSYRSARDLWHTLESRLWNMLRPSPGDPGRTTELPWEAGVFAIENSEPRWEGAWVVTESLLSLMKGAAQERGAELRIVLIPHYAMIHPGLRPAWADPHRFDLARVHSRLSAIADAREIPLLDLTPGFVEFHRSDPRQRPLFIPQDSHLTPLGHCLTAVLVTTWLDPMATAKPTACA